MVAAAIGLPLVAAFLVWGVLHTELGTRSLLPLLPLIPGVQITVERPQGPLLGSQFGAHKLRVAWHSGQAFVEIVDFEWQGATWRWWTGPGLWASVQADSLVARSVEVQTGPSSGRAITPLKSMRLPLEIQVQRVRADEVRVDQLEPFRTAQGRVHLGRDVGARHEVTALTFDWGRAHAQGEARLEADSPFKLQASVEGSQTQGAPFTVQAWAEGGFSDFTVKARGKGEHLGEPALGSKGVALPQVEARQAAQKPAIRPQGPFPAEKQEALCRRLSERAGLDFTHARLDRSTHPFCGGTPTDVRLTTRYNEDDFAQALLGVLHETGHALYERGLPTAFRRQPVGAAAGMAAHESQSLIIEMQSCRSDAYLSWLGPELHARFGGEAAPYAPANLARLWRHVERGFIRVDADEMTYPAHVILRFRLEQALIKGDLAIADLPAAWNEGFRTLLGLTPPDDARGCLQDIHWYDGAFGYFPSYTLGAMAAAQLMKAARAAEPGLDAALARGDLSPLLGWLRANVHEIGRSHV